MKIIPQELIDRWAWTPSKGVPKKEEPKILVPKSFNFSIDDLVSNPQAPFYSDKKEGDKFVGAPIAFQEALNYAGEEGIVANMPFLIAGKSVANKNNYLWKTWFTCNSEEHCGMKDGSPVIIVVHGGGILTPERIKQAYKDGLTSAHAASLSSDEWNGLLEGELPNGDKTNLYELSDVKEGKIPEPFGKYAVILPFELAKNTNSSRHNKTEFMENHLVIARAGTLEHLDAYFEKAKHSTENNVGCYHRFNEVNPAQAQGRLLYLNDNYSGLVGNGNLDFNGRFVGVAPKAHVVRGGRAK